MTQQMPQAATSRAAGTMCHQPQTSVIVLVRPGLYLCVVVAVLDADQGQAGASLPTVTAPRSCYMQYPPLGYSRKWSSFGS